MIARILLILMASWLATGCASLPSSDPLDVTVAGIEPLAGEGLELRMLVKLRVQNPNERPIEYSGSYVKLEVEGRTFATGVSSAAGTIPGFGEGIVAVPVSVSVTRMVRQVMGMLDGKPVDKISYEMSGKLSGSAFNTVRFKSQGEFALPTTAPAPGTTLH